MSACGEARPSAPLQIAESPSAIDQAPGQVVSGQLQSPGEFAVPDAIDEAYVGRVLDRLELVRTELLAHKLQNKPFDDQQQFRIDSIFAGPAREFQIYVWRDDPAPAGFKTDTPAPLNIVVTALPIAEPDCIWVKAHVDQRHNRIDQTYPGMTADIVLRPIDHDLRINPTPWVMQQFTGESLAMVDKDNACDA